MFPCTDDKPGVLPLNECARYPSMGCPVFGRADPTLGTICLGCVARAVAGAGPDGSHIAGFTSQVHSQQAPWGPQTLNLTNSIYKGCLDS